MKRVYHLCWSGEKEVLFRSREDLIHGIVCMCIAAYENDMQILAYCFMSNHIHICVRGKNLQKFIKAFRYSYTRYFNNKYSRRGRLGERSFFQLEIQGINHLLTAIAYILRNPVHHCICRTPFEYEFSSACAVFSKELGHKLPDKFLEGKLPYAQLPSRHRLPPHIMTDCTGMPVHRNIIDALDVEHQFSTARAYLYYMNRLSGEEWEKEQQNSDSNGLPPIRIDDIEVGVNENDIRRMLANETGRNVRPGQINDIELCEIIDRMISREYPGGTIYTTSQKSLIRIANAVMSKYHITSEQLSRCIGYNLT